MTKKTTRKNLMKSGQGDEPSHPLWQGFCRRLGVGDMAGLLAKQDEPVMVALSGGGDSLALTLLLKKWCDQHGKKLIAAHVNHGFRPTADREADDLQKKMAQHDIAMVVKKLPIFKDKKNLHHRARQARYDALAQMATENGARVVMLGHQENDLAENLLMRLSRRAGLHGLAAMKDIIIHPRNNAAGDAVGDAVENSSKNAGADALGNASGGDDAAIYFLRPLLTATRQSLQDYLRQEKTSFFNDPSNHDEKFLRSRTRKTLSQLEKDGIASGPAIATTARYLRVASDFVIAMANEKKSTMVDEYGGMVVVRRCYRQQPNQAVDGLLLHHWLRVAMEKLQTKKDFPPPQDQIIKIIEATDGAGVMFDYPDYWVVSDDKKILIIKKYLQDAIAIKPKEKIIWNNSYHIENLGTAACHVVALGRGKDFIRQTWGGNFVGCEADQWLNEKTSRYFYRQQPRLFWQDEEEDCLPNLHLYRNPQQESALALSPIFI